MLITNHNTNNDIEKMQRCKEYIEALEEERRKIQVFQRELPLCLHLVTQAIDAYKQQLSGTTTTTIEDCNLNNNGQSECSEQTTSEGPVLEEFIPLKRASSSMDDDDDEDNDNDNDNEEQQSMNHHVTSYDDDDYDDKMDHSKNCDVDKISKKSDWLRSAQLWNQSPSDPTLKEECSGKVTVKRNGSNGGAFHPFKREKSVGAAVITAAPAETSAGSGGGSKKEESSQRKQRRCWSPELHRRFLQALQQLGGSHVATPKQIRELMKVDGLTNDEVKSHLQKYRLHTRRPGPTIRNNNGQQAPQFVVVGGIWVPPPPPPEYAAMAAAPAVSGGDAAASNGIYVPIASTALPTQSHQQNKVSFSGESSGHGNGGARQSYSPSASSSTHTTTTTSHSV